MFGRNKKANVDFNFEAAINGKKLPLLILDEKWLELFPEAEMTGKIRDMCEKIRKLLAREGKINEDLKGYKRYKSQLMHEIVDNMEVDDTEIGKLKAKKLDKNQRIIGDLKDKIKEAEEELEALPEELEDLNRELMLESSNECYRRMMSNKTDIDDLEREINELKTEYTRKIIEKQEKEKDNNIIYSYMHNIYGASVMEQMDKLAKKTERES